MYDKTDYEGINREIKDIDWKSELLNSESGINQIRAKFHNKLVELEKKYAPKIKVKHNKKHNIFPLYETAKHLINKKHKLSRNLMKNNTDEAIRAYDKIRKKVKIAMKKLRKDL